MLLLLLSLALCVTSRDTWQLQLSSNLCSSPDHVITAARSLDNSGFHKDLTTHLELGAIPAAFLLENTTNNYYLDIDEIREGLFLGYPPVFPDGPIEVEQPADTSPSHLVGVLCQTHHITLPVHHRYQPAGSEPYHSVCIPVPRVFIPLVTLHSHQHLEAGIQNYEAEQGCKLLHAPCGVRATPLCGYIEVQVTGASEVCSSIPAGMLSHLGLVKFSTFVVIVVGACVIVYTLFKNQKRGDSKTD